MMMIMMVAEVAQGHAYQASNCLWCDDSRAATAELEDQGEEMYAALQGRIISADLMSDLEAARYSEMPLIVK